jgi:hypothetical protein
MKVVDTYQANIYMGLQHAYSGVMSPMEQGIAICKKYCDDVGLGVTFTSTRFIYVYGDEAGFIVGLINYPRFPSLPIDIAHHAETLGGILMKELKQERFSIVFPDKTIMYEIGDFDV